MNNAMLSATFEAHRAAGAPWALTVEPGGPHFTITPAQPDLTVGWMRANLPLGKAGPFNRNLPQVGWLGDPTTDQISSVQIFAGDRSAASRFPMRPLAPQWAAFIGF